MSDFIDKNVQSAIKHFQEQQEVWHKVRQHPKTSLERTIAETCVLAERLRGLQQMQYIIENRDDLDMDDYRGGPSGY